MDFGALPPEINSGRMYSGAGCGPMLAAAAAWDGLAADLHSTAASCQSVISDVIGAVWLGPAAVAMTAATAPYVAWLTTTAALCEQTATQARAAAVAYEAAFAMTVPPPVVAANRTLLMSLIATNILGQNTAAIAATETLYGEMWAQDAAAMYEYAAASAASTPPTFTTPPPITSPSGVASQVSAIAHASATSGGTGTQTIMSTGSQLLSAAPNALQGLALPLPAAAQLLSLLSPVNLAVASTSTAITSTGTAGSYSGLAYAAHHDTVGAGKTDVILERLAAVSGGSGTGASASPRSADLGAGSGATRVLPAGLGRASSIGALSVPPSWEAVTPPIRQVAIAWPNTLPDAVPAVLAASPENLVNQTLLASMALRGIGGAAPQGRPTGTKIVTPRSRDGENGG